MHPSNGSFGVFSGWFSGWFHLAVPGALFLARHFAHPLAPEATADLGGESP
jgi:hypothetical protein